MQKGASETINSEPRAVRTGSASQEDKRGANEEKFISRAEIIWEKGTNRSAFFKGEVDKYGWVDIGSSFLPSEIIAAFLWAQLENLNDIQIKRKEIWDSYKRELGQWAQDHAQGACPRYPTGQE